MNRTKYVLPVMLLLGAGTMLSARHHHNGGLHLAAEIVGLVRTAIAPAPVVVTRPAPVVVTPAAPAVVIPNYGYGWWQGTWVPCYQDWYWYHGTWVWGGRGPRPVPPPWAPDFRRRPMPPPPRVVHPVRHHHPAPPRVVPPVRPHHPAPPRVAPPVRPHHPAPPHHGAPQRPNYQRGRY